jgi:hypothetical protein
MLKILHEASIFALATLVVAMIPMAMGVIYAIRPSDARLALMRPVCLAGLFAGLAGLIAGLVNVMHGIAVIPGVWPDKVWLGLSESLVPLFVAFGSLTVGWLCVALGLYRSDAK